MPKFAVLMRGVIMSFWDWDLDEDEDLMDDVLEFEILNGEFDEDEDEEDSE